MVNITHKQTTLRKAIATAIVKASRPETISAIQNGEVPKGNVFEFARAAGLLGVKKTSDVIPDCHPLPVEYTSITYAIEGLEIIITVEVHAIYRTGVEVEAMHGAAVTALTMYDMLKPIDKHLEISTIKLQSKKGGKSDFAKPPEDLRCAVIVCSDDASAGFEQDDTGPAIIEKLQHLGLEPAIYAAIPANAEAIQSRTRQLMEEGIDLVIFSGGNTIQRHDLLSGAIKPLLDNEMPGIIQAARNYALQRSPNAMFYGGIAGFIKNTLLITVPGAADAAVEAMDGMFPYVLNIFGYNETGIPG